MLRELSEGTTATRVVLAEEKKTPDDLQPHQLVFKVGAAMLIRGELERYLEFRRFFRSPAVFAEVLEPEASLAALIEGSWGALVCQSATAQLAGGEALSLKELTTRALAGEVQTRTVEAVLSSETLIVLSEDRVCQSDEDRGRAFLRGGLPRWSDIHHGVDVSRKGLEGLLRHLVGRRDDDRRPAVAWVVSAAGNGKTTALMRLAYELVRKDEVDVLWRPMHVDPATPLDQRALRRRRPTVVVLDDADLVPNLIPVLRGAVRERQPVHFVLGYSRTSWNRSRPVQKVSRFYRSRELELDRLFGREAEKIVERLRDAEMVEKHVPSATLVKRLQRRGDEAPDLLTAMLLVVKGENSFADIIHNLVDRIETGEMLDAYAVVAAVGRLGCYVSYTLLATLLHVEEHDLYRRVLAPLYQEVRPLLSGRRRNERRRLPSPANRRNRLPMPDASGRTRGTAMPLLRHHRRSPEPRPLWRSQVGEPVGHHGDSENRLSRLAARRLPPRA